MTDETLNSESFSQEQNSIPNTTSSEIKKTPFSEKPADLSGLVSSVLNPKTEEERERIQKEIAKRQAKLEAKKNRVPKPPMYYVRMFLTVVIFCLFIVSLLLVPKAVPLIKKEIKSAKSSVGNVVNKKEDSNVLKVLSAEKIVMDKSIRFTLATTPVVDKVVVTVGLTPEKQNRYEAVVLSSDKKGVKNWEVLAEKLAAGNFSYRCYVKNTLTNEYITVTGNFVIE